MTRRDTRRGRPDRRGFAVRVGMVSLVGLLGLVGAGCPHRPPVARPRPVTFDAMIARRAMEAHLATLTRAGGPPAARAAAHRDLGWLLWAHFGDAAGARAEWDKALHLARAVTPAPGLAAPWVRAGLAAQADLDLAVHQAARAWTDVLVAVGRARAPGARRLPPPPLAELDALAQVAADRLLEQLRHLPEAAGQPLLDAVADAPLPPLVRASLAQLRFGRARRAGDRAAMTRAAAAAGCPASYVVSTRYGRHGRRDLAKPFPPEGQKALTGRAQAVTGCRLTLRSPDGRRGVRYLETTVTAARGGPALVQLAWPLPLVLWVNGQRRHGPDPEDLPMALLRVVPVTLRAGPNTLRLKVPVGATPGRLLLLVASDDGASAAPPRPATRAAAREGRDSKLAVARRATWLAVADLLAVQGALHQGLPDAGRAAAERLIQGAPRFPWGRFTVARLEEVDPLQPSALGRARAKPLLARLLQERPAAARARLRLASVLRQQDKSKDALTLLEAAPAGDKDAARLLAYARVQLYTDLGWRALAAREAEALARRHPGWIAAWRLHLRLARLEHAAGAAQAASARLRALDAATLAWAQVLAAQGKLAEARAELARVEALSGTRQDSTAAAWLRREGRHQEALGRLRQRLAGATWDPERRLALADVLVALGERARAIRILEEGLTLHPEHKAYRHGLAALGRVHPMAAFRMPGDAAIAAYRRAAWAPGTRPVYVLDRTVIRVMPSGGRLILTHQIVHLRTKEAVHRYAEVRLPAGAEALTLRTVKADGSTREPEEIGGKQSVSLPDVDVGDFIEAEYVTAAPPEPWWQPGGFFGSSFTFRSLSAHFFRSELVVASNPDRRITLDTRGPVPTPVVSRQGGLKVTRFTAERVTRLEPEPLSASLAGVLPSVQIGDRVSWADYLAQRRELTWGLAAVTHRVRALSRGVCRGTPEQRARRAFDWVQANIEESGGLYVSAAATIARRSGSRLNLLRALLGVCGLKEVTLHLLWPRHQEFTPGALPPLNAFAQPVLRVTLPGKGAVALLPQVQQAPFGYLPPMLQGALAVSLDRPEAPPARLPEVADAESHVTRLKVVLRKDGSAVISGEDALRGLLSLQMRAALRRVPEKRLRQVLEQVFFGRHFAGATLTQLQFEQAGDLDKPLILRYRLEVPALARATPNRLALRAEFFPARVGRQFAALPSRRLPLQLGPLGPRRMTVELEVPAGYRLVEQPATVSIVTPGRTWRVTAQSTKEPVALDTPYGALRVALQRTDAGARLERSLRVPYRVVPPADYPTFTAIAAGFDRLEAPLLVFQR